MNELSERPSSKAKLETSTVLAVLLTLIALESPLAAVEEKEAAHTSGSPPCDAGALASLLSPGRILLLGEIHGTQEGPATVAEIACAALGRLLSVAVALEIPVEETDRLQQFLASDGLDGARARLLAGEFWQRAYQDGRSSRAMLDLLDALRRLARAGSSLTVTLLDSTRPFASGQERDDEMASRLVRLVETVDPTTLVVSLTGNVHSRSTIGTPWSADYRPAGLAVASRWPERTLSVLLVNPPGTAWTCFDASTTSCGAHDLGGGGDREGGRVELFAAARDGHRARYHLPAFTASLPAIAER